MLINTSIYIKSDLLNMLNEAACILGIPSGKIITILLLKVMNNKSSRPVLFNSVCYQKRNESTKWHCFHISLKHDIYESAVDLRKVFKMSVSFIIAEAIKEYLNEVILNFRKKKIITDNYHHTYIFIANEYDGIYSYTVFRGMPPEQTLKNLII